MKKWIFFVGIVWILASCSNNEPREIKLHLEVGTTYNHYITQEVTISQDLQGMKMNQYMNVDGLMSFKVLEYVDGVYKISLTYEKLKMEMDMGNGTITFDSENPDPNNPITKMMQGMSEESFTLYMNDFGDIDRFEGIETMIENLLDNAPYMDYTAKQNTRSFLEQTYGEETLIGSLEPVFTIYPETTVAPTNTWEKEFTSNKTLGAFEENIFTLAMIDGSSCHITGEGKITPFGNEPVTVNGFEIKYNMYGTSNYAFEVDAETGWIIKGVVKRFAKGTNQINIPSMGGPMDVPMELNSSFEIKSSE